MVFFFLSLTVLYCTGSCACKQEVKKVKVHTHRKHCPCNASSVIPAVSFYPRSDPK